MTASVSRRIQASRRLVRDGANQADVDAAKERLGSVFAAFPGIVAAESGWEERARGLVVRCVLRPDALGRAAALAVDTVSGRVGATVETVAGTAAEGVRVVCSTAQFVRFQQLLYYASELQVAERPPAALSRAPLPTLLGRALGAFTVSIDCVSRSPASSTSSRWNCRTT